MRTRRVQTAHLFPGGWLPKCTITHGDPSAGTSGLPAGTAERWNYVLRKRLECFLCLVSLIA